MNFGSTGIGGGTIGTVIAYPLISLLGMFGAAVSVTGIAIIMLVFTFGLKPAEFILEILDALEERKEQRREERNGDLESRREERMARAKQHAKEEMLQQQKLQKMSKKEKKAKERRSYSRTKRSVKSK